MVGRPTRYRTHATNGSIVAAVKPAISIRRGVVGEIVANNRISTATHDTIGRFGMELPNALLSAEAFIRAMPSAFATMNTSPIVTFVSE